MDGPLSVRLRMIDDDFRTRLTDYTLAMDKLVARLHAGNAISGIPKIGEIFPDFILPDARGRLWRLEDALKNGPLVLSFHRGYWCDFCHLNMTALAEISPQLAAVGCQIVAISPQNAENAGKLAAAAGADFPVLCDVGLGISTVLGLSYVVDDQLRNELSLLQVDLEEANLGNGSLMPITASFVLAQNGVITARHVEPDPRLRMDSRAIVQAACELQFAARS